LTIFSETDLDEVLQVPNVFLNVSKGQSAPSQDLAKAFGEKASINDIILEILNKGELQVGEKERQAQLDRVHNEVVSIVAGKLVDPKTKRVYTTGMIEKALAEISARGTQDRDKDKDKATASASSPTAPAVTGNEEDKPKPKDLPTWTGVVATKSAKSQALDAMKALIAHQTIPVTRARMRLKVSCPTGLLKQAVKHGRRPSDAGHGHARKASDAGQSSEEKVKGTVKDRILGYFEEVESQDVVGDEWEVTGFAEPGAFKGLGELVGGETKGKGRLEVLDMAVTYEGD
jgi:ribosome maturation protein SDO1